MERKNVGYIIAACIFLTIFYAVGRVGLGLDAYREYFQKLVPLNLLVTAFAVFIFHKNWTKKFIISGLIIFAAGFFAELIGVKTGLLFGEYSYGENLGIKTFDIPLIIGLNWLVLIYSVSNILHFLRINNKILAVFTGAALMVILDLFLEPFAIKYGLWRWEGNVVPVYNYICWFGLSALMLFFLLSFEKEYKAETAVNFVAVYTYFLQLVFFAGFMLV